MLVNTLFAIALLVSCSLTNDDFKIFPIHPFSKTVTFDNTRQLYKYYMIEGYSRRDSIQFENVKGFIFKNLDSTYRNYDNYEVIVYRSAKDFNRNYKETSSNLIEWHGNNIVYTFGWSKGKYTGHYEYSNGKIVNKPELQIEYLRQ